jgi:hypothetical protein
LTTVLDLLFEPAFDCAVFHLFCLFDFLGIIFRSPAVVNFLEGSPGWDEVCSHRAGMNWICFSTGLEWTLLELDRAVVNFLELSPGGNDFHRKCTG